MRVIFLILAISATFRVAHAQDLAAVWGQIELNNPTLAALRYGADADKLSSRTGLAPSNPEVEFHYLWGDGTAGNRVDLSIKQSFDFPSVYAFKSKVAKMEGERIDIQYRIGRMELISAVGQLYADIVYYNAAIAAAEARIATAAALADAYAKKLERGDGTQIESNRAQLNLRTLQSDLSQLTSERSARLIELAGFNGGQAISVTVASYETIALPSSFEVWSEMAMEKNPTLRGALADIRVSENKLRVAKSEWLPKISIGYMSERVLTAEHFQGVIAGISLPLWENSRSVKAAKAAVLADKGRAADVRQQTLTRLSALYARAAGLLSSAAQYRQIISSLNSMPLMQRALDAGEITLFEYVTEAQLYYNNEDKALEAERDFRVCYAELSAFEL